MGVEGDGRGGLVGLTINDRPLLDYSVRSLNPSPLESLAVAHHANYNELMEAFSQTVPMEVFCFL